MFLFKSEKLTILPTLTKEIVMQNDWLLNEFDKLAKYDKKFGSLKTISARFFLYIEMNFKLYPILKHILFYDSPVSMLAEMIKSEPHHVQKMASFVYVNLSFLRKILHIDFTPLNGGKMKTESCDDGSSQYATPSESISESETEMLKSPHLNSTFVSESVPGKKYRNYLKDYIQIVKVANSSLDSRVKKTLLLSVSPS